MANKLTCEQIINTKYESNPIDQSFTSNPRFDEHRNDRVVSLTHQANCDSLPLQKHICRITILHVPRQCQVHTIAT